jgi:magnesium and cobalt exporter, CNNM family
MQHRTEMDTINGDDPPKKIVADVLRSPHTRLPVWRDEPDNIVGVLNSKDLLAALGQNSWDIDRLDISQITKEPWFVPDTTSVSAQLSAFLHRKVQLAMVVDEYGEVQGLITLEDILEEIVGEIIDEHDVGEEVIRRQPDGAINVDGSVAIRDINREMDWNLPDEEAVTVAGLVIHEAQTIPEPGQTFTFYGYRFEILRRNKNRITAIRLRRLTAEADIDVGSRSTKAP